ncbi:hypothetical protein ANASTE_00882 [Anaerofustis stercorihominis DSM 17244]|uniref:Uncharacterized protein n=1 Tax=Anaerofustis stercorihominis DSM 17244 TaxID=445971 RepID=B1C825_9FIRM|nr:hypothetical protein ANASTE_00882 [Anaerofustis stercorihominis DSM 17244]
MNKININKLYFIYNPDLSFRNYINNLKSQVSTHYKVKMSITFIVASLFYFLYIK